MVFLHLIPLNESFQWYVNRFSLSFTVFELKGVKVEVDGNSISYIVENSFIFNPILIGVFHLISLNEWFQLIV